ncbi:MAG: DUF3293 domain-containing protein [Verrucomicrobiota bacterium]
MLLPEYLETVFYGPTPATGWPSDFHVITAFNPKKILPEPENHAADTRLRTQLEQDQIVHFRITGCSADLAHQEASWAIVGISLERAIEIGRHYVQNAIFEVLNGEAFVVSCDTLERQSIGRFQERLKASSNDTTHSEKQSLSLEEMHEALKAVWQLSGDSVKIRRNTPEPSDMMTRRFTFRPHPETTPKRRRREPKESPSTLDALKEQLAALKLRDRIVLVGEFYRSYASILDALTPNQMAELMGVEYFSDPQKGPKWRYYAEGRGQMDWYYHRASLTLKSRGHKIVFFTKYNDAEDKRSFTIG